MSNEVNEPGHEDLVVLLKSLQETPGTISTLIDGLSTSEIRWRDTGGEFSVLENVCHLRDIEAEGYATRISRILNEADPFLADIDGGRLAVERSYNEQDLETALRAFVDARTKNLEQLRAVSSEAFERRGTLEGVGPVTLKRLVYMMSEHDAGHTDDLRVLRQKLKRLRELS